MRRLQRLFENYYRHSSSLFWDYTPAKIRLKNMWDEFLACVKSDSEKETQIYDAIVQKRYTERRERWSLLLWYLTDHTSEEFLNAWETWRESYSKGTHVAVRHPVWSHKDNTSALLGPERGGKGMRVPRKCRSKRTWDNFYRLYPHMKPTDNQPQP